MNLEILVSTMHQKDNILIERMNIQSDAIIINQCNENGFEEVEYRGNIIRVYSFAERGVGLSRNSALMRASADIVLFSDEDVSYVENYKKIIGDSFMENPNADVLIFNVPSTNPNRPSHIVNRRSRVRIYNCLKYGAVNIAIRTTKVRKANIYFSLLFGGGAKYSAGEDSLFISDCIKRGLKVYTVPKTIGYVSQEESSWFEGYTDKYFIDKGIFFSFFAKRWAGLLCLQFAIRHKSTFRNDKSIYEAVKLMFKGIKEANK